MTYEAVDVLVSMHAVAASHPDKDAVVVPRHLWVLATETVEQLRRERWVPSNERLAMALGIADAAARWASEGDFTQRYESRMAAVSTGEHDHKAERRLNEFIDSSEFRLWTLASAYLDRKLEIVP